MSKSSDVIVTCALADAIITAEIAEKDVNIDLIIIGYLLLAGLQDLLKRRKNFPPIVHRIVRWVNNISAGKDDTRQTMIEAEFFEGGTIGPVVEEL